MAAAITAATVALLFLQVVAANTTSSEVVRELETVGFVGEVATRDHPVYEEYRAVRSGQCNQKYPLVIIRPLDTEDVARGIKVARRLNIPVSVRSGGHSYTCQGIKSRSLHIDLRTLNKVQWADKHHLLIGAGNNFGSILKKVNPAKHTMVHGECEDVGFGGFLLGGGNGPLGLTAKHGWGCDNISSLKMVTADGDIITVDEDGTTWEQTDKEPSERAAYNGSELFFGMKGAGISFGIVTEFKYRVYNEPEPYVMSMRVLVETPKDLKAIKALADEARFHIHLPKAYFYKVTLANVVLAHIFNLRYIKLMAAYIRDRIYGKIADKEVMSLGVTDLESSSGEPDITEAIAAFKRNGVRLVYDQELMYRVMGLNKMKPGMDSAEGALRGWAKGFRKDSFGIVSATFLGVKNVETLSDFILYDETFGLANHKRVQDTGCLVCTHTIYFLNKDQLEKNEGDNCLVDHKDGALHIDLTCIFDTEDVAGGRACQNVIKSTKEHLNKVVMESEGEIKQYSNLPSCDNPQAEGYVPFYERYWGSNYGRLLEVKRMWDPDNVFSHCHSVGSTEEECCDDFLYHDKNESN